MADFEIANHGSICLITPMTPAAHDWADAFLDEHLTWGQCSVVVEPRYVEGIVRAILEDGMTIQ